MSGSSDNARGLRQRNYELERGGGKTPSVCCWACFHTDMVRMRPAEAEELAAAVRAAGAIGGMAAVDEMRNSILNELRAQRGLRPI